ncbi:Crp/Fnr family transcriptional regulator [Catalinimonas niigatensis]|uniref:Crp/Fnr family transcriptional regulator n=1 Tax=Catalinimonas niigatensis TaxID=1397264 RepID=UPI00266597BD|nr:Crp/Fnr family transcriptional regulator [Catalinimonas niigatensis]WPP49948.1 Crp/Fnr family transcriptional regulator [Catalinimonas niigatensis]
MDNLKKYLATITDFSEQSWAALCHCLTEVEFQRNEQLLKEGQTCHSIFFISSGLCKSFYNMDGKEINTAFYFENDFATNIKSLITASKSEYTIKACEKTKVVQLDKAKLLEAYNNSHQIETFGRKVLEQMIAKQEEHSDSFKLLTPKQRFDSLVLKHPNFLQRVSLTQTASYLGISRETLSRFRALKSTL